MSDLVAPTSRPVVEAPTMGATLARKLAEAQQRKKAPKTIALSGDASMAVRYRVVIPKALRDQFRDQILADDSLSAHIGLLTAQCEAVLVDGEETLNSHGKPIRFTDPEFLEGLAAPNAREALFRFYGGADGEDGAIDEIFAVANAIYEAGGPGKLKDGQGNPLA